MEFDYENENETYNTRSHKERCKAIYDSLLSTAHTDKTPMIVRLDSDTLQWNEQDDEVQFAEFSVLTKEIYDYDRENILREFSQTVPDWTNTYRPFFVSFTVEINRENKDFLESLADNWYIATFTPVDNQTSDNDRPNQSLIANLVFSASPVRLKGGRLTIYDSTPKWNGIPINDLETTDYDPTHFIVHTDTDIQAALTSAWENDIPKQIDFYNVGKANADYIRGYDNHRILFDVGYESIRGITFNANSSTYPKASNSLRQLKPNIVIISHWDTDHYIGCAYADSALFRVKWIAPALSSKPSLNSFRLAAYLMHLKNLLLVNRSNRGARNIAAINCKRDYELKLNMGGGAELLTYINRKGLYLEFTHRDAAHTLLAADVPYKCMGTIANIDDLRLLHVPHHCSRLYSLDLLTRSTLSHRGESYAIITTHMDDTPSYIEDPYHKDNLDILFGHDNVWHTIYSPIHHDSAELLSIQAEYDRTGNVWIHDRHI